MQEEQAHMNHAAHGCMHSTLLASAASTAWQAATSRRLFQSCMWCCFQQKKHKCRFQQTTHSHTHVVAEPVAQLLLQPSMPHTTQSTGEA
jgi:hypothetical protein